MVGSPPGEQEWWIMKSNDERICKMIRESKIKKLVYASLVLGALCMGSILYLRLYALGFSAREKPLAVEAFLAKRVRRLATPSKAISLRNPLSAASNNIGAAGDFFAVNCASCHDANGDGKTVINSGLYPPAPDLRGRETQNLTDGELFYIIRNGIRFTGMPGWEEDDDDTWRLVLFIRQLPELNSKDVGLIDDCKLSDPCNLNRAHALPKGETSDSSLASR
jgi:mono/diheme cytochrome c family protein